MPYRTFRGYLNSESAHVRPSQEPTLKERACWAVLGFTLGMLFGAVAAVVKLAYTADAFQFDTRLIFFGGMAGALVGYFSGKTIMRAIEGVGHFLWGVSTGLAIVPETPDPTLKFWLKALFWTGVAGGAAIAIWWIISK